MKFFEIQYLVNFCSLDDDSGTNMGTTRDVLKRETQVHDIEKVSTVIPSWNYRNVNGSISPYNFPSKRVKAICTHNKLRPWDVIRI